MRLPEKPSTGGWESGNKMATVAEEPVATVAASAAAVVEEGGEMETTGRNLNDLVRVSADGGASPVQVGQPVVSGCESGTCSALTASEPLEPRASYELVPCPVQLDRIWGDGGLVEPEEEHVSIAQPVEPGSEGGSDAGQDEHAEDAAWKCSHTTQNSAMVVDPPPEPCQVGELDPAPTVQVWSSSDRTTPEPEPKLEPEEPAGDEYKTPPLQPESTSQLALGSEVRVSLDHIIDDALVVSFRLGEKVFSGVLMDLSKRFGPYGIPVTVFPNRDYREKPESMQLKTEPLPLVEDGGDQNKPESMNKEQVQTAAVPLHNPSSITNQWTLKIPPLFQEGAPYPPPLFIRDTYSQSLPQPPPRKIKRPKRKLYREEPTSIMNAIKLRPRQVLCDKCKGVVSGEKREVRRGPGAECRSVEETKRRRGESLTASVKRSRADPRVDEKSRVGDGPRRQTPIVRVSSSLGHAKGSTMVKTVTAVSSHTNNSKVQLSTKKVLQNKNGDHSKAREVLKFAKVAQRKQRNKGGVRRQMTRSSSSQDHHRKVHFTRRLHQSGGGSGTSPSNTAPLPPRIRIKPQRYRNEENNSSCKLQLLDKGPGNSGRAMAKPALSRCASTRSSPSCSTVVDATTATAASAENLDHTKELESDLLAQNLIQPEHHLKLDPGSLLPPSEEHKDSDGEPEEHSGRDKRTVKSGNLTVYLSLTPSQPDLSNISVCSVDSTDDLKSSNSECSSTETFDFPPPGSLRSPPHPSTSSVMTASTTTTLPVPKEDKKPSKPLKTAVFSKNVSKCVTADGRTICVGDIVWAKIYGFPWWPARILVITVSRKDNGLLLRQEARISWFGSPTTSFLALSQVTPFLENFQTRFDKKRKGLYRKAIAEAAKAAKQLTPEVRALLTQFET